MKTIFDTIDHSVRYRMKVSVTDPIWGSVYESAKDYTIKSVRDSVKDFVWHALGDSIWDCLFLSAKYADCLKAKDLFDENN